MMILASRRTTLTALRIEVKMKKICPYFRYFLRFSYSITVLYAVNLYSET